MDPVTLCTSFQLLKVSKTLFKTHGDYIISIGLSHSEFVYIERCELSSSLDHLNKVPLLESRAKRDHHKSQNFRVDFIHYEDGNLLVSNIKQALGRKWIQRLLVNLKMTYTLGVSTKTIFAVCLRRSDNENIAEYDETIRRSSRIRWFLQPNWRMTKPLFVPMFYCNCLEGLCKMVVEVPDSSCSQIHIQMIITDSSLN
ncbi:hypothetical protein Tco_0480331 [Tanacetum coccineum]